MGAREEILQAADKIFGAIGFDAASTREIAEACGVNKALIHYHFKSKDGLLADLLDGYYEKLTATVTDALAHGDSLRERMFSLADAYADFLAQNMNFCRIVQRESSGGNHAAMIRQRMQPLFAMGQTLIQQELPATKSGTLAAEQLMVSIYGMIVTYYTYGAVIEPLLGSDAMTSKNLAARKAHIRTLIGMVLDAAVEAGGSDAA